MNYEASRKFIYRNARPLDLARWKFLFEGGSREEVLTALMSYQNEDGGFGNALEPDCWNPDSAPVQTWTAMEVIKELKIEDSNHPVITGILTYLSSENDFNGHTWMNSVPGNNHSPHAPWWNYDPSAEPSYNPTASFIGFVLKYADRNSSLYELATVLAREAYEKFISNLPNDSMHTIACYVEMYEYMKEGGIDSILDMEEFLALLQEQIRQIITYETEKWTVEYVCKPSLFIHSKDSSFFEENEKICHFECDFIRKTQQDDGTWNVTWSWSEYPEEWSISKNWWKSDIIIKNLKFLKEMEN